MNARPPIRLLPAEPLLFRSEDGQSAVAFKADDKGQITRIFIPLAVFAGERLAWYESPALHIGLILSVLLRVLSALALWPLGALTRRLRARPALPVQIRTARWIGAVVRAWRAPGVALFSKLHLAVLTLAFVLFVPVLQYWNRLGFRY